jgi:signal transduction histidine kinase
VASDSRREVTADPARLRSFLVADALLSLGGVAFVLVVWATVVPSRWMLLLALMVSVAGAIMVGGLIPLRHGRVEAAVACLAVANWSIAVMATTIATFAWPVLVSAALLAAVVSVPYVSRRALHRYLGVSLAVSCAVTALGVLQDVTRFAAQTPEWVINAVTITFVPAMAALLVELSLANRAHLQRVLDAALQANDDLRRSEEALADAVDELRASRARVVAATDEERRRIARDLHDGSQQRSPAGARSCHDLRHRRPSPARSGRRRGRPRPARAAARAPRGQPPAGRPGRPPHPGAATPRLT